MPFTFVPDSGESYSSGCLMVLDLSFALCYDSCLNLLTVGEEEGSSTCVLLARAHESFAG